MPKRPKTYVKYANFHIASAATKYTLHVNGFTGTLLDALKEHNRRPFSTFDADNNKIFTVTIAHCCTAEAGGFLRVIAIRLNLMDYTTLEVGWESIHLIKTSQTVIQEFTGYQMGSMGSTVKIPCYLQK